MHLPATAEENEDELEQNVTAPVPQIQVSEPKLYTPVEADDPMDDVDKSIGMGRQIDHDQRADMTFRAPSSIFISV